MTMPTPALVALAAAALFGISTPVAKALLDAVAPQMLAGLLYAGSGIGLMAVLGFRALMRKDRGAIVLPRGVEWMWLAAAILVGGSAGPFLLMLGLTTTAASTASLLLNLETVFTALLAWYAFHENFDRRIALGMALIVVAGVLLASASAGGAASGRGAAYIAAACLCWALDNNLTRKLSSGDALFIAGIKGIVAGTVNLVLAISMGDAIPSAPFVGLAMAIGLLCYGVSLVLFVVALRQLGTARTGAYFSVAPFFGAIVAVLFYGDPLTWQLSTAAILMGIGVLLHLSERHVHEHMHEPLSHEHSHVHDEHHRHPHAVEVSEQEPHTHWHAHPRMRHAHPHFPDIHHRHRH